MNFLKSQSMYSKKVADKVGIVVFTNVFIEHLRDTVDSFGLKNCVYWSIFFGEMFLNLMVEAPRMGSEPNSSLFRSD